MRRLVWAAGAAVVVAAAVGVTVTSASANTTAEDFRLHERDAGQAFLDLGTTGPGFGDQLVGRSDLTTPAGAAAGTDTFTCTSVSADGATFQCAAVYTLKGGRVTVEGNATVTGKHPLFDEQFAVTGGTKAYQKARGQVRIVQNSQTEAELTFHLLP